MIRHLRSYVKKVPSEQRRFDLNDEVAEAVKFLTPEARSRGVILRSKLASVPLPVSGNPIQLEQVLSNLILNANGCDVRYNRVGEGSQRPHSYR